MNTSDDPEYWRNRAEEARAIAVQMKDPHTKATMLAIAQDYESSPSGPKRGRTTARVEAPAYGKRDWLKSAALVDS